MARLPQKWRANSFRENLSALAAGGAARPGKVSGTGAMYNFSVLHWRYWTD